VTTTRTTTPTRTHVQTATYLADAVLGSIADILGTLGVDATVLFADWDQDSRAIAAWITEQSLAAAVLELHHRNGTVDPVLEFPVRYRTGGEGDSTFTTDRASLARYLAKLRSVPAGTTHKLVCVFAGAHSPQPGWSAGTRAPVAGLRANTFGTLASAPHATAQLRYYTT